MGKAIKAILYDLDGILVETRKWHYDALNIALKKHGFVITPEMQRMHFEGLPTLSKLQLLTKISGLSKGKYETIIRDKYGVISEMISKHTTPDEKKIEMLSKFKAEGYIQGVCTNTTDSTVKLILNITGMNSFIDLVLTRKDISQPKPYPEIYIAAIDRLKLEPSESLILEDSLHGYRAAKASGAHAVRIKEYESVNYQKVTEVIRSCSHIWKN